MGKLDFDSPDASVRFAARGNWGLMSGSANGTFGQGHLSKIFKSGPTGLCSEFGASSEIVRGV